MKNIHTIREKEKDMKQELKDILLPNLKYLQEGGGRFIVTSDTGGQVTATGTYYGVFPTTLPPGMDIRS